MSDLSLSLTVKLASLVVHMQEFASPTGHGFDIQAAKQLATDPEVSAWLDSIDPALLPSKR